MATSSAQPTKNASSTWISRASDFASTATQWLRSRILEASAIKYTLFDCEPHGLYRAADTLRADMGGFIARASRKAAPVATSSSDPNGAALNPEVKAESIFRGNWLLRKLHEDHGIGMRGLECITKIGGGEDEASESIAASFRVYRDVLSTGIDSKNDFIKHAELLGQEEMEIMDQTATQVAKHMASAESRAWKEAVLGFGTVLIASRFGVLSGLTFAGLSCAASSGRFSKSTRPGSNTDRAVSDGGEQSE